MTINKQLRELAEKATPGPWWIDSHGHRMSADGGLETVFIASEKMGEAKRHPETGNLSHWPNDWDASFIAAANPATILTLLDENEALQAECEGLRKDAEFGRSILSKREPGKAYGCHCDLEEGMEPDGCVIDSGERHNCLYAKDISVKEQCSYWRVIASDAAPQPAEQQPAPDVAALVEALEWIAGADCDPGEGATDFAVAMGRGIAIGNIHRKAAEALAAHRNGGDA